MKASTILLLLIPLTLVLHAQEPDDETLTLTLGAHIVDFDGKQSLFREQNWQSGHSTAGIEDLYWRKALEDDLRLTLRARGIAEEDDYGITLRVERPDSFFVEVGSEQYRKYFDDTGGFYNNAAGSSLFSLDEDLHLDIGRVWARAGLVPSDGLELVLSYEYRYKNGEKSLLEWNRPSTKQIHPAAKFVDETSHILQLDVSRDFADTYLASSLRYERFDGDADRSSVIPAGVEGSATDKGQTVNEAASYEQLTSSNTLEHWHEDWLLLTAGYFYLRHRGDAEFAMNTVPGTGGHDKFWFANDLDLDQDAHLLNLGAMLMPSDDLQLTLGLELEESETDSFGDVDLVEGPTRHHERTRYDSQVESSVTGEQLELRYSGLPLTTVYAKGSFRQNDIDREEEALLIETPPAVQEFLRDTDEDNDRATYRLGFSTSPVRWLALNSYLQRSEWRHDYKHRIDEAAAGVANTGYSAFISAQDIDTDEATVRLVLKPSSWLRTALQVRLVDQKIESVTDAAASSVVSGDYDARIYSLDATLTPTPSCVVSCGVSLRDTATRSPILNAPDLVADYEGDVWTASASVQYQCNARTNINLSYAYWASDNEQGNLSSLPLNIAYTNHVVSLGVKRQYSDKVTGTLGYQYTEYSDDQYQGELDYSSHGLYALIQIRFR